MIARVLQLRYPQNPAALGLLIWTVVGCLHDGLYAMLPRATGRCAALQEFHRLRTSVDAAHAVTAPEAT